MTKWINVGLKLFNQFKALQRERDKFAGKTSKPTRPPTQRVESGVRVEYTPDDDGDADPGEVVWAWVPFEDDPSRGKDRPVVVIGRSGSQLAGIALTSKNKGRDHVPVGTGGWDPQARDSYAKVEDLLLLDAGDIRREGAALGRDRFDSVIAAASKHHDLVQR